MCRGGRTGNRQDGQWQERMQQGVQGRREQCMLARACDEGPLQLSANSLLVTQPHDTEVHGQDDAGRAKGEEPEGPHRVQKPSIPRQDGHRAPALI